MGGFSLWHWIVVLIIVLLLFGRGRVSEIMGDFGKGLKSFKQGMAEDDKPAAPPAQIPAVGAGDATIDAEAKAESQSKPQ